MAHYFGFLTLSLDYILHILPCEVIKEQGMGCRNSVSTLESILNMIFLLKSAALLNIIAHP